jgi:hypothetical protein
MKKLFCLLYDLWLSKFVDEKTDPLVVLLDFIIGSSCKYCMAVRGIMVGLGLGLFNLFGLGLIALAILFTIAEKHWLCDTGESK